MLLTWRASTRDGQVRLLMSPPHPLAATQRESSWHILFYMYVAGKKQHDYYGISRNAISVTTSMMMTMPEVAAVATETQARAREKKRRWP